MINEKNKDNAYKWIKIAINIMCIMFIILTSITTIVAASFSVHQSDDFHDVVNIITFGANYNSRFRMSIDAAINEYLTHQGTWIVNFIRPLLMPLYRNGMSTLKTVQMSLSTILLFSITAISYLFPRIIFKYSHTVSLLIGTLFVYMFSAFKVYYEVFYWYTGIIGYGLPLFLGVISFIFALFYVNKNKRIWLTLACIVGFVSTGGTLGQAGLMCYVALVAIIYKILCCKKLSIKVDGSIIYFIVLLVGAIINVAAPGNYKRLSVKMSIVGAIKNTLRVAYSEYTWLFRDTNILIVIFILALIGFCAKSINSLRLFEYATASVIALFAPFVCIFPVVLGYGSPYVANRGIIIVNFAMYASIVNISVVIGFLVRKAFSKSEAKVFGAVTAMIILVLVFTSNYSIKNMCFLKTARNVINGSLLDYQRKCCELFEEFEQYRGKDVVFDSYPQGIEDFSNFFLENSWVNDGIADYYGMNSLTYLGE